MDAVTADLNRHLDQLDAESAEYDAYEAIYMPIYNNRINKGRTHEIAHRVASRVADRDMKRLIEWD